MLIILIDSDGKPQPLTIDTPLKDVIEVMRTKPRDHTWQLMGCKQMSRLATEGKFTPVTQRYNSHVRFISQMAV